MKIAIDDGSNYIKGAWYDQDGKICRHKIQSAVIQDHVVGMDNLPNESSYIIDGKNYAVNNSSDDLLRTNTPDYQYSDANLSLVHEIIRHATKGTDVTSVDIVLSLPVGTYLNPDNTQNKSAIDRKIENIKKGLIEYANGDQVITINRCFVVCEGYPAYLYATSKLGLSGNRNLIIEVGGTTTEMIQIDERNNIINKMSLSIGSISVLDEICTTIQNTLQKNSKPTHDQAITAIKDGVFGNIDKQVLTGIKDRAIEKLRSRINDNINQLGDIDFFDNVILSGGGASLLDIDGFNIHKTANPQFDNANGMIDMLARV